MQADTTSALPPQQARDAYLMGAPKPACQEERERTADGIHALQQFHDGEVESILRLMCKVFDTHTASMTFLTGKCIHILEVRPALQVHWFAHGSPSLGLPPGGLSGSTWTAWVVCLACHCPAGTALGALLRHYQAACSYV